MSNFLEIRNNYPDQESVHVVEVLRHHFMEPIRRPRQTRRVRPGKAFHEKLRRDEGVWKWCFWKTYKGCKNIPNGSSRPRRSCFIYLNFVAINKIKALLIHTSAYIPHFMWNRKYENQLNLRSDRDHQYIIDNMILILISQYWNVLFIFLRYWKCSGS